MSAKSQLLAAARAGGSAAVRDLMAAGGPMESIVVRYGSSLDLLQYRLTDQNYHSVRISRSAPGFATLSAPCGYRVEDCARALGLEVV